MELPAGIRINERVLILGIPDPACVSALAEKLRGGLLVAVGDPDAVYLARKAAQQFDNVMFVPGTSAELPWGDGFFTRVIDTVGDWPDPVRVRREIERVTKGD